MSRLDGQLDEMSRLDARGMRRLDGQLDWTSRRNATWDEKTQWSARQDELARTSRLDDR